MSLLSLRIGCCGMLLAAGLAPAAADDTFSTSPSYRLQPTTINAGGSPASSASRRENGSLAQELVIGTSSAPHYIVQSGFWGFTGSGLVPVVLSANRTGGQPASVDLTWSGNNASYDVYRNTACVSIFSGIFSSTSDNAYTDPSAPTSGLTCYNVLAFAPGPVPPPETVSP
jgi:hypothetical protein